MGEQPMTPDVADLAALARVETKRQPVWVHTSEDLNVNLLVFDAPSGVAEHTNDEVDVLLVGIAGQGTIVVEGETRTLAAGGAIVIPKGARRAVEVVDGRFAYLTCHRRRAGLWPRGVPRPGAGAHDAGQAGEQRR